MRGSGIQEKEEEEKKAAAGANVGPEREWERAREREGVLSWPHRSRPRHVELAPAEVELDLVVVEGDAVDLDHRGRWDVTD